MASQFYDNSCLSSVTEYWFNTHQSVDALHTYPSMAKQWVQSSFIDIMYSFQHAQSWVSWDGNSVVWGFYWWKLECGTGTLFGESSCGKADIIKLLLIHNYFVLAHFLCIHIHVFGKAFGTYKLLYILSVVTVVNINTNDHFLFFFNHKVSDSLNSESQSRGDSVQSLESQAEEFYSLPVPVKTKTTVLLSAPPKTKRASMFGLFKKK